MKYCSRCDTTKPLTDFTRNKLKSDGLQLWCRICYNTYLRGYYRADIGRATELSKKTFTTFYKTIPGRATFMLNNVRARAKKLGVAYDLDKEWLVQRLSGVCEATGLPFEITTNGGKGHRSNPYAPSVDRIVQDGPYTKANCRMTVWIYNRARGAFPDDAFNTMIMALVVRCAEELEAEQPRLKAVS